MKKKFLLFNLLIATICNFALAKDSTVELLKKYEIELTASTNKYSFATNRLAVLYKKHPSLASDLTVLTIKNDISNRERYVSFFNNTLNRRFNTNLLNGAALKTTAITITSQDSPRPIQIHSYGGADPSRP